MLSLFIEKFITKIESYQKLALFVHTQPDFDVYASAFGLKKWINDNYPEKEVILMIPPNTYKNNETFLFKSVDNIYRKEQLYDALGIILDTPIPERILTQEHIYCKELVVIDHHPKVGDFGELQFIDPTYPANSQILAEIFLHLEDKHGKIFNSEAAQYLYAGILTDTNNLMSLLVKPSTYVVISKLILKGINRRLVHDSIFIKSQRQRLFNDYVSSKSKVTRDGLAYSVINTSVIKKYNMFDTPNIVNCLDNTLNVEVWCTLMFDIKLSKWKCSIRSRELQINNIAKDFGGGGHKTMAAVVFNKKRDFYKLLSYLNQHLCKSGFKNVSTNQQVTAPWSFYLWFVWFKHLLKDKYLN